MEEETDLGGLDEESRLVLLTGREYTQPGSVVSNCILLIGSPEGECGKCTKPCLHPLATDDIKAYFQNASVQNIDWLDDTACIIICENPTSVNGLLEMYFDKILCVCMNSVTFSSEESGLECFAKVIPMERKEIQSTSIVGYASQVISRDLRKAKMVNNIIKRRKELQNAKKKTKAKKNKRKRQRMKKQLAKEQENTSAVKEGDPET
ncbi:hypothetical protein JH06_0746 [Blastocystis sp. subtype 4]|uniref:hypothetical protein n=1 Tax=Blastocystis sp. subtype 4 TaxID=944170 RepID=UPI0007118FB3|nr:hypothetical protein JH06_0746 [Blastocystis sp. subtype 4]KNB45708.1 hypothetical protein JH06_0746 [Blastocystis sp. subtype 4]|eukprot:XP_014529151.1 hypothetical protein JH06_0746 [Blastocystis sp. subtype 4]